MEVHEKILYCYDWFEKDDFEGGGTLICGWCLDKSSIPYLVTLTGFTIHVYIELPLYIDRMRHRWSSEDAQLVVSALERRLDDNRFVNYKCGMYKTLYRGSSEFPMLRLEFNRRADIYKLDYLVKKPLFVAELGELNLKIWEEKIPTIRQFLTNRKLKHAQWFKINCSKVDDVDKASSLEHEYIADYEKVISIDQKESKSWISFPHVLTIDIEVYSDNPKAMPIATMAAHVAYMISCIFQKINDVSSRKRYIIIMGDCSDLNQLIEKKMIEEKQIYIDKITEEFHNGTLDKSVVSEEIFEKLMSGIPLSVENFESKINKVEVIRVRNEHELCNALTDLIYKLDPEIMSGYNILGFDYKYLNTRLARLVKNWNSKASRIIGRSPELITPKKWESKAYGFNANYFLDFPGRISIDMLPIIRRGHKLPKYDLDTVGNAFLKRGKHDIKAAKMFEYYEALEKSKNYYEKCIQEWHELKGTKKDNKEIIQTHLKEFDLPDSHINTFIENDKYYLPVYRTDIDKKLIQQIVIKYEEAKMNMAKVALYCIEDSELVVDLIDKTGIWIGLTELSNTVGVSIVDTYSRGQQIRGMNLMYDLLEQLGIVIDYIPPDLNSKFSGGFVADPDPGIDDLVDTLDFAGLYPSIIMAFNICMSTYLKPGEEEGLVKDKDYTEHHCAIYDDNDVQIGTNVHRFLTKERREGYIPRLVSKIVNERKAVKVEMKDAKEGTLEWTVLNERQLALKTCANSIYGMLGVKNGALLPFLQGAETVTAIGREKIKFCNKYLIDKYKAKIVYNDTDSTMFTLPFVTNYAEAIEWGKKLEKELTDTMPKPMALEFEKTGRMLRFKKKKYSYWVADMFEKIKDKKTGKWVPNPGYGKLKDPKKDPIAAIITRGIVLARRDNCKLLRDIYRKNMEDIMNFCPMKQVLSCMMKECIKLLRGDVNINDMIIIRTLGSNYKSETYFVKLFGEQIRAAGKSAEAGDRIEYIICKGDGLLGLRMRTPEMYYENLASGKVDEIDYRYYLEKLFIKPLEQLWSVGYRKELDELEKQYDREDKTAVLRWIYNDTSDKRDKGEGIKQVWNNFNGDIDKICEWLAGDNHKYLHNKYVKARQSTISGRSVFNARITKMPIKQLLKSIDMNHLENYCKVVLMESDYNELFPIDQKKE